MDNKIDFVITWVNGNDSVWCNEKEKYEKIEGKEIDNRNIRYRDIECLKYWFRGIEKFAPWVNKVYFITCGHLPEWLNTDNTNLVIVNHKDYISEECLPTFNSDAIELGMHKIKGLEEKFVYFNDDMFLINNAKPKDFFKKGLPKDSMCIEPITIKPGDGFYKKLCNNIELINKHFNYNEFKNKNKKKFFSLKQGKFITRTLPFFNYKTFVGFHNFHVPISYLKSTFKEVWGKEQNIISKNISYRFRDNEKGINHWVYQYWQFASGKFYQRKSSFGKFVKLNDNEANIIIEKQKCKVICINDTDEQFDFEKSKEKLIQSFEKILPEKSKYEL